jgi:carbamoyl-phosphate synthase small subunit
VAYEFNQTIKQSNNQTIPHVVCYDFGVKTNILRSLASWAKVTVVPAKTPAEEVLAMNPDGVFLSNGPADPAAVTYAIENIRKLLGFECLSEHCNSAIDSNPQTPKPSNIPIMGICLGHQLLSLACGAKTGRLKFGHHGCNHPVKNLATGHVEITSQNHNFAVLPESVPDCLEVTHVNLNDGSIEGVRHKTLPAFSVQYHPESCPGPHDSQYLFDEFRRMITDAKA